MAPRRSGWGIDSEAARRARFALVALVIGAIQPLAAHAAVVPLVARKVARDGRVTAHFCVDRVCDLPTSDPGIVAKQIA
jgi:hypothetical protein